MSSHWYRKDGSTQHTITSLNGKERDTNLGDAKKHGLLYSYSYVAGVLDKSFLNTWKQKMLLEMVALHPYMINKDDKWKETLIAMSEQENNKYSRRGAEIHNALEQYYKEDILTEAEFIAPVIQYIEHAYKPLRVTPELVFAHPDGYGGTIDLVIETEDGLHIVDFKTKSVDEPGEKHLYDSYVMQLGCYQNALTKVISCSNILISVTKPGQIFSHTWSNEKIEKGLKEFKCLLEYCKTKNNYNSSFVKEEVSHE